ncbi:MAG: recombinase family protein [Solirubrobacteraceae bacterium]
MFFAVLGAVGEFERDLLSERTRDGLQAARARGRTGGRKSKLKPAHVQLARQMRDELDDDGSRRQPRHDLPGAQEPRPPTPIEIEGGVARLASDALLSGRESGHRRRWVPRSA